MNDFKKIFFKKKVLITGHTGFKGSWLTLWLLQLGAKVIGISKDVPTKPSFFHLLKLNKKIVDLRFDLKNLNKTFNVFEKYRPNYLFHLAAQSLVKKSFKNPVETFTSNTFGTLNILECLRNTNRKITSVIITSDKSYKNLETNKGYVENDILGGIDPYSASKSSAEMVINSYINCFLKEKKNIKIAVARAGNVVGGGDWSEDRLIPDCVKCWYEKKTAIIRSPKSTRPWQHVLEALRGYLILAINLDNKKFLNGQHFNFGPKQNQNKNVISFLKEIKINWKTVKWKVKKDLNFIQESKLLRLNSNKAKKLLNWQPILKFKETAKLVTDWYMKFKKNPKFVYILSVNQINEYASKLRLSGKK